ncbi:hypothetical protein ABES25_14640 [Bacillus gobiensis]|uniref:tetratricopeptide repeat protein n=1 Tax=Bacillus gobiensis TaxID=1441095 RepID=UPI003D20486B
MTSQLINKTFYKSFIDEHETKHPILVLAENHLAERQEESNDLSAVRYAQGEVYFHHKDYEAAIFKWENIEGELGNWSRKNIADSYYELKDLTSAEDIYTSIKTDDKTLLSEIYLKLFFLYQEKNKTDRTYAILKKALYLDPDYPMVTELARRFYEEERDDQNATELAIKEAIRTEDIQWFHVLKEYVEKERAGTAAPDDFYEVLIVLYRIDQRKFVQLIAALWNHFRLQGSMFPWLETVNNIFLNIEVQPFESWQSVSALYKDTYSSLINGQYYINKIQPIVPTLLVNWLKISVKKEQLLAASAVLTWNEISPASFDENTIHRAQQTISDNHIDAVSVDDIKALIKTITNFGKTNELSPGNRSLWWINKLTEKSTSYIMLAGFHENKLIHQLLGDQILTPNSQAAIIYSSENPAEAHEISDQGIRKITSLSETGEKEPTRSDRDFIEIQSPNLSFDEEKKYAWIHVPSNKNAMQRYLPLADGLLFQLEAKEAFNLSELDFLLNIREQDPTLSIHFAITGKDSLDGSDTVEFLQETKRKIKEYFSDAEVFTFNDRHDWNTFLQTVDSSLARFQARRLKEKLLFMAQILTKDIIKKKEDTENEYLDLINWNKDILSRLEGFIYHYNDREAESIQEITSSYKGLIDETEKQMKEKIPEIIRKSTTHMNEKSDFRKIHIELNKKMNEGIQAYLQDELLPSLTLSLEEWLNQAKATLSDSQVYLNEMSDTFNSLYGKEKLKLACDFRIFEDWKRDLGRMTGRAQIEQENILLRSKPAQLFLKGAGKLLGGLSNQKSVLYNQYKKYIENESYEEVANSITRKFLLQFDLFKQALEHDINLFYQNPYQEITETIDETKNNIETSQNALDTIRANPEQYTDPLTLFDLKRTQYEWLLKGSER